MPYLYDTHLHTRCASACSSADPKAYVASYQEAGFTGIIITDHFFNGNCRIPQGPWKDMVDAYCRGYEEALEEGYRRGFSVFFGGRAPMMEMTTLSMALIRPGFWSIPRY